MPWRRIALGVCAALLLVLGPAAVPDAGTTLPMAATTAGRTAASWVLTADTLYTTHRTEQGGDDYDVVARPLTPGAPDWTRRVHSDPEQPTLRRGGDLLFVETSASRSVTTVLDAVTGAVRWPAPDPSYVVRVGDRVLQQGYDSMSLVDPADGRVLWRRNADKGFADVEVMGRYLVGIGDGEVATLLAATGEQVAGASIGDEESAVRGDVVDSRAYAWTPDDLTALRLPDLTNLWTVPIALVRAADTCGLLLCVTGADGVTAVDRGTGAVRWNNNDLAEWNDGVAVTRDGHVVEVDGETGQVLDRLGRGRAAGDLMLRVDRDQAMWVTVRDGGQLLGTLREVTAAGCAAVGDHLACPTPGLNVAVWNVRGPRAG